MASGNPAPNLVELADALKAFVDAPTWDESRRILEARRGLLLTLDAPLALVRRMGHAESADRRGLLSTSARLLMIARDSGIDAAWEWLDNRHRAQAAFAALLESLKAASPEEASATIEQALDQLPPQQRRYIEESMLEAAEAAEDDKPDPPDPPDPETDPFARALRELLETTDDAAALDVIGRDEALFTDGRAEALLRDNAKRIRQDPKPEAQTFADRLERLAGLLSRIAREGLAAVRRGSMSAHDLTSTVTTLIDPQRVPLATDRDRALVAILIQSGQLSERTRRGLEAWTLVAGAHATREEIAEAYGLYREITRG